MSTLIWMHLGWRLFAPSLNWAMILLCCYSNQKLVDEIWMYPVLQMPFYWVFWREGEICFENHSSVSWPFLLRMLIVHLVYWPSSAEGSSTHPQNCFWEELLKWDLVFHEPPHPSNSSPSLTWVCVAAVMSLSPLLSSEEIKIVELLSSIRSPSIWKSRSSDDEGI